MYSDLKVAGPKRGEIEITGQIPPADLEGYYTQVLEEMRKDFSMPGFRKGNVPMETFQPHANQGHALEEAAELALADAYPAIIEERALETLGRPEVTITKLALGNPMEFKIVVGARPVIKLPNYKKIAGEVRAARKPMEVTDADVEEVVTSLRKLRAAPSVSQDAKKDGAPTPEELPELTDEFVRTLGSFETILDFKVKLRENLKLEKETESKRVLREAIAAKLAESVKMELPERFVEGEAEAMFEQLRHDLEHANLSLEDYLKRSNTTEETVRKSQREYAERQIRTRLILEEVAKAESIEPNADEVRMESELLRERNPELEPERIARYVTNLLRNEKVLEFLEKAE